MMMMMMLLQALTAGVRLSYWHVTWRMQNHITSISTTVVRRLMRWSKTVIWSSGGWLIFIVFYWWYIDSVILNFYNLCVSSSILYVYIYVFMSIMLKSIYVCMCLYLYLCLCPSIRLLIMFFFLSPLLLRGRLSWNFAEWYQTLVRMVQVKALRISIFLRTFVHVSLSRRREICLLDLRDDRSIRSALFFTLEKFNISKKGNCHSDTIFHISPGEPRRCLSFRLN